MLEKYAQGKNIFINPGFKISVVYLYSLCSLLTAGNLNSVDKPVNNIFTLKLRCRLNMFLQFMVNKHICCECVKCSRQLLINKTFFQSRLEMLVSWLRFLVRNTLHHHRCCCCCCLFNGCGREYFESCI